MLFRSAHSAHSDWSVATEECLLLLSRFAGNEQYTRQPNLGFLYLTAELQPHAEQILMLLKSRTGIPNWVGATGMGIAAANIEYTEEPALAVMLAQLPVGSFNVFSGLQRPPSIGTRTDNGADAAFTALVHGDPATPDLPELVLDMARKVSSGYLFGGLASGRDQVQTIADRVLSGGLSGVVFASDVNLVSRVTQGVYPLPSSQRRKVTDCSHNVILQLDHRPAFDVLLEDAGIREPLTPVVGETREEAAKIRASLQELGRQGLFIGMEPLDSSADDGGVGTRQAYRERTPHHDYIARHVVAIDPSKRIVAIGAPTARGQHVRFCTRDENSARKDLVRICAEIRDHLHEQQEMSGEPVIARGAVYVSCVGRGSHMFGEQNEELRIIQSQLGEVPLVGFYANGEIAGQNLYGFTGVLTVFY